MTHSQKKPFCQKSVKPSAMIDPKGNLMTTETNLKTHTINHYKSVLSNMPIHPNLINLKEEKEDISRLRIELAKLNTSNSWNMEDLHSCPASL